MVACFLLGISMTLGQTDNSAESAPAVPVVSAPADRWLLMNSLQGTWPGSLLDEHRLQISGWTDVSFTASSAEHSNLPLGFNYLANEGLLQQNWLRIEQSAISSGASEPTFGFRSDTILPGTDYRFTLPRGLFNSQLTDDHGQPNLYGIDPIQFYGEAFLPLAGGGVDVKLGRFFAQFGVESNDAPSNALCSHAYTFIYDPFTQTGLLTTIKINDSLSFQAGVVLGSDVFIDPADQPTFIGSVKWSTCPATARACCSRSSWDRAVSARPTISITRISSTWFIHAS